MGIFEALERKLTSRGGPLLWNDGLESTGSLSGHGQPCPDVSDQERAIKL